MITSQRADHGYLRVSGVSGRVCVIHLLNLGKSRNILPIEEISIFMILSNTFKQLLTMSMFLGWVLDVIT